MDCLTYKVKEKSRPFLFFASGLCLVCVGLFALYLNRWQPGQLRIYRLLAFLFLLFSGSLWWFLSTKMGGARNKLISLAAGCWMVFWSGESVFLFYEKSHGTLPTLAHFNWYRDYFSQVNKLGFRDLEMDEKDTPERKIVFFLGDSYTEGAGIKKAEDRFSNMAARELGEHFVVFNLGRAGTDTRSQIKMLQTFPVQADQVVLVWVPNDIISNATEVGMRYKKEEPYSQLIPGIRFLVSHSHLLDALYQMSPHSSETNWKAWSDAVLQNEEVWKSHKKDLALLKQTCVEKGSELRVLVFPYLDSANLLERKHAPIFTTCAELNLPVWDAQPIVDSLVKRGIQIIVNPQDLHPSRELHFEIGKKVSDWIQNSKVSEPIDTHLIFADSLQSNKMP